MSLPAVREAMRILETEGLVEARRGNVGGAIVHLPTAGGAGDPGGPHDLQAAGSGAEATSRASSPQKLAAATFHAPSW